MSIDKGFAVDPFEQPKFVGFELVELGYPRSMIQVDGEPTTRLVTTEELHERVSANQEFEDRLLRYEPLTPDGDGFMSYTYRKRRKMAAAMERLMAEQETKMIDDIKVHQWA